MIRWLEILAVSVVVAFVTAFGTLWHVRGNTLKTFGPEVAYFNKIYGAPHFSYGAEEWVARHFFKGRQGGVFLDVGAGDPKIGSNTLYLEQTLGWSGVAIDAQGSYAEAYAATRPRTRFVNAFVSDVDGDTAVLHEVAGRPDIASGAVEFTSRYGTPSQRRVPTVTLTSTLDRLGVAKVDFLSLDVELFEPKALAGFDIARFRPELVCVESHPEVRQALIEYFTDRSYVLVGTYLRLDAQNLYFAPRGRALPQLPGEIYGGLGRTRTTSEHGH
jgi:FkbM family methyltransferase